MVDFAGHSRDLIHVAELAAFTHRAYGCDRFWIGQSKDSDSRRRVRPVPFDRLPLCAFCRELMPPAWLLDKGGQR